MHVMKLQVMRLSCALRLESWATNANCSWPRNSTANCAWLWNVILFQVLKVISNFVTAFYWQSYLCAHMMRTDITELQELLIHTICHRGSNRVLYKLAILLFDFLQDGRNKIFSTLQIRTAFHDNYKSTVSLAPQNFVRPTWLQIAGN
jgi:hypothetical protein